MRQVNMDLGEPTNYHVVEAYKTIRTNILFCGPEVKAIAITSCTPSEGKTTVSWNLAMSMAESGKKVIYIDADLRKSVFIGKTRVEGSVRGLSHYLSGQADLDEVIYATPKENLSIIFAGSFPPNPAELLGGETFKSLIQHLRNQYDYIIVDTPPLGSVIDSALVANVCDGAVMVLSVGNDTYKMGQYVKEQLEKGGCRILGAILNKVDYKDNSSYYGKYYRKYYSKYYGESESGN